MNTCHKMLHISNMNTNRALSTRVNGRGQKIAVNYIDMQRCRRLY